MTSSTADRATTRFRAARVRTRWTAALARHGKLRHWRSALPGGNGQRRRCCGDTISDVETLEGLGFAGYAWRSGADTLLGGAGTIHCSAARRRQSGGGAGTGYRRLSGIERGGCIWFISMVLSRLVAMQRAIPLTNIERGRVPQGNDAALRHRQRRHAGRQWRQRYAVRRSRQTIRQGWAVRAMTSSSAARARIRWTVVAPTGELFSFRKRRRRRA